MSKFIKIEGLGSVSTCESIYGHSLIQGDNLIIPFYNVQIVDDDENSVLKGVNNKFIKFSYLLFEGVTAITWDYNLSCLMDLKSSLAYGGTCYHNDQQGHEFWIKYKRGYIYLEQDYESSFKSWERPKTNDKDFDIFFKLTSIESITNGI